MSETRMAWDGFRVFTPERSWALALRLVAPPIRHFSDVRIWGRERIPRSGPVILAANHQSFYDIFVLGAERAGLPDNVRRSCDLLAEIPLAGAAESLNVAMAGTIALYEWSRQRL